MILALLASLVVAGAPAPTASTRTVTVAAAADLKYALDDVITAFKKSQPDVDVKVTYGSSGNFAAQLQNGAPFDVFLSADIEYPHKLVAAGLVAKESVFPYAVGRLVVWTPHHAKAPASKGLTIVADPAVRKVAIANPAHAPYGRAAQAALEKNGLWEKVKDKLVLGENIAQTAQFVETGGADVGLIALSLAVAPALKDKGTYVEVPLDQYPHLLQGGCVMSKARDPASASALRDFLVSDAGKAILAHYGFTMAAPTAAKK